MLKKRTLMRIYTHLWKYQRSIWSIDEAASISMGYSPVADKRVFHLLWVLMLMMKSWKIMSALAVDILLPKASLAGEWPRKTEFAVHEFSPCEFAPFDLSIAKEALGFQRLWMLMLMLSMLSL